MSQIDSTHWALAQYSVAMMTEEETVKNQNGEVVQGATPATPAITKPVKDNWDKLAAVAPIISGALIFLMGGFFTYMYNEQQLRLQEIQTIEKFIPHLMGNDRSKRAAILAISSLTNAELAGKFAQIFASQGTVSALQSIAETGSDKDKSAATSALAQALENLAARESRLNDMETAYQKAMNKDDAGAFANLDQSDEATRLEKLAQMCRDRGQTAVADSLLKQAQNMRARLEAKDKEEDKAGAPPPAPNPAPPPRPQVHETKEPAATIEEAKPAAVTESKEPADTKSTVLENKPTEIPRPQ